MSTNTPATQGHSALAIAQQYPVAKFNLLVPMQTVTEVAEIHHPVMNTVQISTDLNDKEIYVQEKGKNAYTDRSGRPHDATPPMYALTKKGLTKLMRAAGIKILSSRPVVPSTCQKCANVNVSIGKPVRCGACTNKDVKYEVRISVPQLTGENIDIVAHKEIIVDDVVDGMTDLQKREFLKFRNEMCESKALTRALRTALQVKSTYFLEELKKPFVVAYLVPNLDNPDVKAEAVKAMFGAKDNLYGGEGVSQRHTIYVEEEDSGDGGFAPGTEDDYVQEPRSNTPAPASQEPEPPVGRACEVCGVEITDTVADYSRRHYGRHLCRDCQRTEGKG